MYMKDLIIIFVIKVYEYDEFNDIDCVLLDDVIEVIWCSYVFYLYFLVGVVVLLVNGVVVIGIN